MRRYGISKNSFLALDPSDETKVNNKNRNMFANLKKTQMKFIFTLLLIDKLCEHCIKVTLQW